MRALALGHAVLKHSVRNADIRRVIRIGTTSRALVHALVGPLRRPWAGPGAAPWALRYIMLSACVALIAAAALAGIAVSGSLDIVEAAVFSALIAVGQFLVVRLPNDSEVDCSSVFIVAAAIGTSHATAALAILTGGVLAVWLRPPAWRNAFPVFNCNALPGLVSIGVVATLPALQHERWGVFVLVPVICVAWTVYEVLYGTFEMRLFVAGSRLVPLFREAVAEARSDAWPILASQMPMMVITSVLAGVWLPFVAVGIGPHLASWRLGKQAAALAAAELAAGTDALTGLPNRARFFDRVTAELDAAGRYDHGLSLIMGDLDNFKRVNDTLGHLAGDEVLKATAAALAGIIDDAVFPLARYGGEEFVIAIPVLGRDEVLGIAERVRAAVEAACAGWGTSISLGIAYHAGGDRIESLIDRADKALYSAKYAGKNRVHEWNSDLTDGPVAVRAA